jgi:3-methylcrotonyl-CoA carboxylase alpha subunit
VHWQLRVAAGQPFPFEQASLSQRGHAIECRLYAEDPANGFLPDAGQLLRVVEPRGPGIRFDSGVSTGSRVSHYYDPLLAKLIVHAADRPAALRRMQTALREVVIHGVATNVDFLQAILAHPDFRFESSSTPGQAGVVTTSWVESVFTGWASPPTPPIEALIAAALSENSLPLESASPGSPPSGHDPYSPWKLPNSFRL